MGELRPFGRLTILVVSATPDNLACMNRLL